MKSLRHRLPSLISLMTFEAAARTLNFTRASEELHVSQVAVSKQVKYLEEFLEVKLFIRSGRKVELTHQGKFLYKKLSSSLNFIADAVDKVRSVEFSREVTLSANSSISHYWLSRVIESFRDANPDFTVRTRIISSDCTLDLYSDEVDIAIVYDAPEHSDWVKEHLFAEELYPVASPKYLEAHPLTGEGPESLLSHPLLDYERLEPNWIDWRVWLRELGIDTSLLKITNYANNYLLLVNAAEHSQGITLGTRYLLDGELATGKLVRVSNFSYISGRGYYLVKKAYRPPDKNLDAIYKWIKEFEQHPPMAPPLP